MSKATGCTLVFSAKCEISTWKSNKNLKLCIFRIELLLFPCNLFQQSCVSSFQLMPTPLLWLLRPENSQSSWCLSFFQSNPSESFLGSTFRIFLDSSCFSPQLSQPLWSETPSFSPGLLRWLPRMSSLSYFSLLPRIYFQHRNQWSFKNITPVNITLLLKSLQWLPISLKSWSPYNGINTLNDLVPHYISNLASTHFTLATFTFSLFLEHSRHIPASETCFSCSLSLECSQNICVAN